MITFGDILLFLFDMVIRYTVIVLIFIIPNFLFGQEGKYDDKIYNLFHEGIAIAQEAESALNTGDIHKSEALALDAIEKFQQIFQYDSTNQAVLGPIAHSYFMLSDFAHTIEYYEAAIKYDYSLPEYHLEYGLAQISIGNLEKGREFLQVAKSLESDNQWITSYAIDNLYEIGVTAFQYGVEIGQCNTDGNDMNYKKFAIGVLMTAYEMDTTDVRVILQVAEMTQKFGDTETSKRFFKKLE